MATINGSVSSNGSKYKYWIDWYEDTVNIGANTSVVHASVYVQRIADYQSYNTGVSTNLVIDGQTFSNTTTVDMNPNTSPVLLCSASKTISHNSDGTRSIGISASTSGMSGGGFGPNTGSASATVGLTTIPRAAYLTSGVDFTVGNGISASINNPGNLWIRALLYVNGNLKQTANLGQTSTMNLSFNSTEINSMYSEMPNATQCSMYVIIQTFSDSGYSSQVGSNQQTNGTCYINQSINHPNFSTYALTNVDKTVNVVDAYGNSLASSSTATLLGSPAKAIKGYSKVRATILAANKMVAQNYSTASFYRLVINGATQDASYSTSDVNIDTDNVSDFNSTMTAYDSRGLATTVNPTTGFSVIANYFNLFLYGVAFARDNGIDAPTKLIFYGNIYNKYFSSDSTTNPGSGVLNAGTFHYRWKNSTHDWQALDGTVTITIASPAVVSKTAHGFNTGDQVWLSTSGALPTGLSVNTVYYVIYKDANSFYLATSLANANAGTKINTSGSQSGTHTVHGDSMWTSITPTIDGSGNISFNDYINGDLGAGGFDGNKSFDIQVRGYDKLSATIVGATLNVGQPVMHITQAGVAFGKKYDGSVGQVVQFNGKDMVDYTATLFKSAWHYAGSGTGNSATEINIHNNPSHRAFRLYCAATGSGQENIAVFLILLVNVNLTPKIVSIGQGTYGSDITISHPGGVGDIAFGTDEQNTNIIINWGGSTTSWKWKLLQESDGI